MLRMNISGTSCSKWGQQVYPGPGGGGGGTPLEEANRDVPLDGGAFSQGD